jgi:hypothetical protein
MAASHQGLQAKRQREESYIPDWVRNSSGTHIKTLLGDNSQPWQPHWSTEELRFRLATLVKEGKVAKPCVPDFPAWIIALSGVQLRRLLEEGGHSCEESWSSDTLRRHTHALVSIGEISQPVEPLPVPEHVRDMSVAEASRLLAAAGLPAPHMGSKTSVQRALAAAVESGLVDAQKALLVPSWVQRLSGAQVPLWGPPL